MNRTLFDDDWSYATRGSDHWRDVDLPHDAMLHEERDPASPNESHTGWFPGGSYVYRKQWTAPPRGERVSLIFEGVYQHSRVLVNGHEAGGCKGGYTEFEVRIDPFLEWGTDNAIEVHVDNSEMPNSRWYSGSGIYRHVWLLQQSNARLTPGGILPITRSLTGTEAVVEITVELDNPGGEALEVAVRLEDAGDTVAAGSQLLTGDRAHFELVVLDPRPWSAETPTLYGCVVELSCNGILVDEQRDMVGLRTIGLDASRGLLINGEPTLLRGACIHHDHGVLGAATFRDAEFRRARILKEQGFNAVRSSHNPLSRDMLDACDSLGLYVMDENTDVWFQHKTAHDAAPDFDEVWRDELEAMIRKDRTHPSVIMYSIGNEISEMGTPRGIQAAREMVAEVRRLDPSRPTTAGVNLMLTWMASRGGSIWDAADREREKEKAAPKRKNAITSTGYNYLTSKMGWLMAQAAGQSGADKATRGVFDVVDVAGYNYAHARYRKDGRLHPGRIIVGSETMHHNIASNWKLVKELPYVIGDFMWTGWEYLGEAGIGTWTYGDEPGGFAKPYPYVLSGNGAIDLIGQPGAPMLLARTVWGLSPEPLIAVRPVDKAHLRVNQAAWRGTDAVPSWAWPGQGGKPARIEVYSDADEVELFCNGESLGTRKAGPAAGFTARFRTTYVPGELLAVARRAGREVGRSTLRSTSGVLNLRITADRTELAADGQSLAHLLIEVVDASGTVAMVSGEEVEIHVDGVATIAGLGSAALSHTGSYTDFVDATFQGRALAVVRAGRSAGATTVTATSPTYGTAEITLNPTETELENS